MRVEGLGFRVQDLGSRVQGSGFRVEDSGSTGFGVQGLSLRLRHLEERWFQGSEGVSLRRKNAPRTR